MASHSATSKGLWKEQSFFRNVAILASGTAMAQLLPILASPALTRLYSPEQFGLFAIFMAFVSSLMQASTGHYEVAMITPKSHRIAKQLFAISVYFTLGFVIATLFGIVLFKSQILGFLDVYELASWVFMVPLMLLALGLSRIVAHYANRNGNYTHMAHAALLQGITIVSVSLLLGVLGFGFEGLIMGYIAGSIASFIYIWWREREVLKSIDYGLTQGKLKVAREYKDYPLFSGSMSIFDGLSLTLPTFFMAAGYPDAVVGYYALVMRILYSPLTFLSSSVGQVNLKKVVDLIHARRPVLPYLHRISLALAAIAALPALVLMLFGPELFGFFFGKDWRVAGEYAQILAPALIIRFTASTLSSTLGAARYPRLAGLWKLIAFVATLLVLLAFYNTVPAKQLLEYLVITDIVLYLFYYVLIYYSAARPRGEL